MDRLWGALAGSLSFASILALWFGAWGSSLLLGLIGSIIAGLLAFDEFHLDLGPVQVLRVGKVWSLDLGRRGVYGIGLDPRRIRLRRLKIDG